MNSVSDAHSCKRIKDFEEQGFKVKAFGFDRNIGTPKIDGITILGTFSNTTKYHKRIIIYLKGIKKAFKIAKDKNYIWFYQGLDTAIFATFLGRKHKYIYEECDLVHTNIKNNFVRKVFEIIDKRIIKNSYKTIVTSEGYLKYHYKDCNNIPKNVVVLPNRLSSDVKKYPIVERNAFNPKHIKFAFIGGLRYKSLLNLAKHITQNFPNNEFHFYGYISQTINKEELPQGNNVLYHGAFRSPEDLPKIYAEVDVVVATYDTSRINVKYAEPNKLYESIYFNCPIVVSRQTYLEEKVKKLNIGYSVNPYDESDVKELVKEIENNYQLTKDSIRNIQKDSAIDSYQIKGNIIND